MEISSPRNQKVCRAPHQKFIIPRNQKKHVIYHPKSSRRKPLHGKFITQKLESLQSPSPDIHHAEIRKNMKFITKRLIGINPHLRNSSPRNQKTYRAPHQKFIIPRNQKKHFIYHPKSSRRKPLHGKFITQKLESLQSPHQKFVIPRNQKKHVIYNPKSSMCKPQQRKFITQKLENSQSP